MNKIKLLALTGLTLLALTLPTHGALFDSNPSGTTKAAIPGAVNERGYSRSKVITTNAPTAGLPHVPAGITNTVVAQVTNHVFEIPIGPAGPVPVGFSTRGSAWSPSIGSPTNYFVTCGFNLSYTGTNDADFTTHAPLIRRFAWPTNNLTQTAVVWGTNFTTTEIAGARFIKFSWYSNDANLNGSGSTNNQIFYPSNAVFGAKYGPANL